MRKAIISGLLLLISTVAWTQAPASNSASPLTLDDALLLAKANNTAFRTAQAEAALAHEDRVQARAALLPGITYNNQFLYTQGRHDATARYIASNAVHEYVSQGNAHLEIGLQQISSYRKAGAAAALARANAEVATRGLTLAVVQSYCDVLAALKKNAYAQSAADEAKRFLELSRKLESGGEVAHSDVLKAQLQANDREFDRREAAQELLKARMELAVLVFPTIDAEYALNDDLESLSSLPEFAQVQKVAAEQNPQIRAALSAVAASHQDVIAARAGYLPTLSLDYFCGIDATHFAISSSGIRNLGYATAATLNIPVFNWGATQSKVRQSLIREGLAQSELSTAQKKLLADMRTLYGEATTSVQELVTLRDSAGIADESLRLITLRYQAGESTVLEVVDAQNALRAARNAYVDGCVRRRVALANLQLLMGTI